MICLAIPLAAAAYSPAAPAAKQRLRGVFEGTPDAVLTCPTDKSPLLTRRTLIGGEARVVKESSGAVTRRYPVNAVYADLLAESGRAEAMSLDELRAEISDAWGSRVQTQMFRSPLIAFLYERGWRQNFRNAGFPGIGKEYEEVREFFAPAASGVIVDMSCGSGLMARRILADGAFSRLLACDYSEVMLRETRRRIVEEKLPVDNLELVRVDVAELPMSDGSISAMHAGAALHSWPRLEAGLAEIHRVLEPSGRFWASTFLQGAYGVRGVPEAPSSGLMAGSSFRFFKDEAEIKQLLVAAGFSEDGVEVRREGRGCAIIRAIKAPEPEGDAAGAADPTDDGAA